MYKRDTRFSMVFPALLAAVLFVPFVMNFLAHAWYGEKHFPPLTMMKLPADSSVINLPREIKQYKPFEITLQLNTRELARRINDIVKKSHPGTELQGIRSEVFPEMHARIAGNAFSIDPPEPQAQFFSSQGEMSRWSWIITPEKTGRHHLSIELYLQTAETPVSIRKLRIWLKFSCLYEKTQKHGYGLMVSGMRSLLCWQRGGGGKNV